MRVLVFCATPGLTVAGVSHPRFAEYPLGEFSEAQLRALIADRNIRVAVGKQLTADHVADFAAEVAASTDATQTATDGLAPAAGEGKPAAGKSRKARG